MLDVAHVGDFGISKILATSKFMAHTETLGTLGYIAPEEDEESTGILTDSPILKTRSLLRYMKDDVVDTNLFPKKEQITSKSEMCIASMIELALDCTNENPELRITMKEVVKRLDKMKNTFLNT
ncbi:hypothetical protein H5410_020383 [Solanum commersonii]|uniref:Protein kinase domain-containing protein n=1 Tax=Solanum commersonii TaxID=4109 RepID=A0A9J5ZE00_SOLCO|nr:hypothetical protein H5410_020383 [Solanum commersonii]